MKPLALRVGRYSARDGDVRLARQEQDTLALCEANDYDDGGWFGVDDESGNMDTRARQGKGELPTLTWVRQRVAEVAAAEPGRPIRVVAWKEARLWRDVTEKEALRRFLSTQPDAKWHTYEGIKDPRSASDTFVSTVIAGGNQFYADSVRENVLRAHDSRRARGLHGTGYAGFGHRISEDRERVEIVPEEAELIRRAVEGLLDGTASMRSIAADWNAKGVPTRRGKEWRYTAVRQMLESPRLAGIGIHNGVEYPGTAIEPIIEVEAFRRLQRKSQARRLGPRESPGIGWLVGTLWCPKCEDMLNRDRARRVDGKVPVYSCRVCRGSQISGTMVEEVLSELLFATLDEPTFVESLNSTEDTGSVLQDLELAHAELADLEAAAADLPVSILVAKSKSLKERIAELDETLLRRSGSRPSAAWMRKGDELRAQWEGMPLDLRRTLALDVLRPMYVTRVGREGAKRVSRETVLARLVPRGVLATAGQPG